MEGSVDGESSVVCMACYQQQSIDCVYRVSVSVSVLISHIAVDSGRLLTEALPTGCVCVRYR